MFSHFLQPWEYACILNSAWDFENMHYFFTVLISIWESLTGFWASDQCLKVTHSTKHDVFTVQWVCLVWGALLTTFMSFWSMRLGDMDWGRDLDWFHDDVPAREVSNPAIIRLRDRVVATEDAEERRRSGRPRSTTKQQDRYIVSSALRDRTPTAMQLREKLVNHGNVWVSDPTGRNWLHWIGFQTRRPTVHLPLIHGQGNVRRTWCTHHLRWTRQQWSSVLFTDESRFTLSFNDRRVKVWWHRGERFQDACVQEHERHGRGSVVVWGGIGLNRRTTLYRIRGNFSVIRYRYETLQPIAFNFSMGCRTRQRSPWW